MMNSEKLITLLTSLLPYALQCRAAMCEQAARTDAAAYHTTGPVPIGEVRNIYRTRARLNAQRGGPIRGFEDLLTGLETQDVALVLIHSVQAPSGHFFAFTDPAVGKLIGLLELPPAMAKAEAAETPQDATAHAA